MRKKRKRKKGRRKWWNGECKRKKKVERALEEWKRGIGSREDYKREKKKY